MPRRVLLTRRDWLKVSALAGGGLALGLQIPPRGQAATWRPPETRFSPNAWIRIHGDGRIQLLVARSEMGQGVMTALPMLLAEELEVPLSRVEARFAPAHPDYVNRLLGQQATGGSTSVREAWTPLREAGAAVREMLIEAAAITWGVPVSECRAANARVRHQDDERSLGYGQLATLAASLPLPESVLLKGPSEWHLIGTERPRLDVPHKVSGRARFGLDVRLPGMLFASVERCPVFGGKLRGYHAHGAKTTPGVLEVLEITGGVAVIARDTWSALKGRRALNIEWSPAGNGGLDTDRIRARFRAGLGKRGALAREQGDALAALETTSIRVEAEYEVPFQAHACMEPMNCTADVRSDHCAVHVPTQAQGRVVETARRITGLPAERISVHTTFLGGGFGRRGEQDFVADAVELSHRLRRPVQVLWTREDDIRHDFYRPMTLNRLRGGIDESGNLVAWFHRIVGPSILGRVRPAAIRGGIDPTSVDGAANLPYAIPNLRVEYRRADTPVPVGFWRSVGNSQNTYVTECFLDELARAAGKEPLTLRRTLLAQSPRHLGVLELAARHAGWGQPPPEGRSRGIAVAESFGSFVAQVAEISIAGGQVRVHRVVCAVDCGRVVNPDTVRAQMQSGIAFGLTAALKGSISIAEGRVQEGNFDDYPLLRADEMPAIDVYVVASDAEPGGVGEPGTPPIAPAVANAVYAATGRPVRRLPIRLEPAAASGA
jgi:isoquinoline 1-oxidoreductase subunit beta